MQTTGGGESNTTPALFPYVATLYCLQHLWPDSCVCWHLVYRKRLIRNDPIL